MLTNAQPVSEDGQQGCRGKDIQITDAPDAPKDRRRNLERWRTLVMRAPRAGQLQAA